MSDFAYPIVGGTERYVMDEAEYLASLGNEVTIISPVWTNGGDEDFVIKYINGIRIVRFKGKFRRNTLVKPTLFIKTLFKYCDNYNIIIGHYYSNAIVACLFAKLIRAKSVGVLYEVENVKNRLGLRLLNNCDKIITISHELKSYLLKKGINNITVITPAIKGVIKASITGNDSKQLIVIGRVIKGKGIELTLKSLKEIVKTIPKVKMIFIGSIIDSSLVDTELSCDLIGNVIFTGFVNENEKENYLKNCTALLYVPNYKGGYGYTLLEAMKYGKPVIGSDNYGVSEAVGNGGLIIKSGDVKELTKAINTILTDPMKANQLREEAIKQAERHEFKRVMRNWHFILEDLTR